TQYVDKDGNPLVKAKDGNYYPKDKVGDDGQPKPDAQAVDPAGIQVGEKDKPTQLTNVAPATKAIDKPNDPTNGLADLASAKDGTVATVADLKNLGFVIKGKAADGTTDVTGQVKHANIVEFAGEDLAKVVTESANGVSKVTVKVNKEDIVKVVNDANDKKGSAPTQYVDKDGNPLVKGDDGKYYKQNPDGTPNKGEGEQTPAGIKVGEKDKPMQLDNVARGTESKPVNGEDGNPIMGTDNNPVQLVDLKDAKDTKVATVGDLKDMGFVVAASVNAAGGDKAYQDVVKNGNKVKFVGLGGAWISGKTAQDGTRVITIDVNADNLVTGTQNAVQYVDAKGNRMIPILQTGKEVLYYNAADNPVKHKMPNSDKEAIYKMSDIAEDGTLKADAQPLQGKKAGEVPNLGVALVHPNGSAETDKGTVLHNVGEGTATIGAPKNADDKVGKAKEGLADLDKSKDTNGLSVADAKKLGWVISTGKDGKDFAGKVQTADEVNFQGEENGPITVTGSADGSKRIVTIGVDAKKMAAVVKSELDKSGDSNLQYVDDKGNPLVKVGDKYYTKDQLKDDGQLKDGAKESNPAAQKLAGSAPMQLKNVAPGTKSIEAPKEADAKPADKAKAGLADLSVPKDADKDTDAKNTAATVDDLRRMGWVLSTGDDYAEKVQNANEINFKGVDGVTITGKTDGGKRIVSVGVDAQAVLEHADIPIVYKDKDNKPVTKVGNDFYAKPEKADDAPVFVPGENGQKGAVYKKSDLGNDGKPKAEAKPLTPVDNGTIKTALNGADPRVLSNVAPGTDDNDAATYGQVKKIADGVQKAVSDMSNAVSEVGSDAAALAGLQPLQYDPLEPTQVMAAIGGYRGGNSVALGVAHYTNESTMLHAGITFGGNSMFNIGLTKKFGHSDEEKMIPQRYRSGPISSVYVMQDEVSKLKAENEQQKQEIKELREMVMALMGEKKK
ncbi:YadA-like family protein, partial [Dialister micraerophilus]